MSNNLSVIVLTPHGRRNTVKCNPNTTILQILEQTCAKHNFEPNEYDLTHHRHVLDVTSTFRFSGLPNNALLEMVQAKTNRKESEVVLGLQLENGERKMGTFNPSVDLYKVLTTLAPDESSPDTHPVLIYMRNEVYGEETLKKTTLKSLGLTGGKAMIRLIHRTPEQLKNQANVSSPLIAKPRDLDDVSFNSTSVFSSTKLIEPEIQAADTFQNGIVPLNSSTPESTNILNETFASETENKSNLDKAERMDIESDQNVKNTVVDMDTDAPSTMTSSIDVDESQLEDEIVVLGERNALVFSQDTASHLPLDDLPDDFYELSVNEVRKLFQDLVHSREEMENTPLQIAATKKLEEEKTILSQLKDYQKVVLRIAFPDRTVLQGTFRPLETIKTVMDFVRDYLEEPKTEFNIYFTPPKEILKPELRLVEAKCVPSAILHFGPCVAEEDLPSTTSRRYLKKNILDKLTSPEAAKFLANKSRGIVSESNKLQFETDASSDNNKKSNNSKKQSEPYSVPGPSKSKDPKVPKWFRPS